MIKTRINFIKRLYPDYIIFLKEDDIFRVYNDDLLILKRCFNKNFIKEHDFKKINNINYIVFDNLKIIEEKSYINNKYDSLLKREKLILALQKRNDLVITKKG